jgi:hypothetical protein
MREAPVYLSLANDVARLCCQGLRMQGHHSEGKVRRGSDLDEAFTAGEVDERGVLFVLRDRMGSVPVLAGPGRGGLGQAYFQFAHLGGSSCVGQQSRGLFLVVGTETQWFLRGGQSAAVPERAKPGGNGRGNDLDARAASTTEGVTASAPIQAHGSTASASDGELLHFEFSQVNGRG